MDVQKTRQPYIKPSVNKLTPEQARMKLLGIAAAGDEEKAEQAKQLLKMMFPSARPRKKSA